MVSYRFCPPRKSMVRQGSTWLLILAALVVVVVFVAGIWYLLSPGAESNEDAPVVSPVVFEPFDHVVLEAGEIESSNNVEVKCQVKSRNSGGTEIVWVIDEGAIVKKDDVLVKLDSSMLAKERDQQKIVCNTSHALMVQAENAFLAAEIALREYKEGTYEQERQLILNEIFVANENLERTNQSIASTERLASLGLTDTLQLQADQFAVEKARNELALANKKLEVLDEFTSQKMIKTLESDIITAKAKWVAEKESHALEQKTLAELEEQVAACTITAPADGQVVHANRYSSRGGAEFVVEQGAKVGEGKTIIRIPDPSAMQVRAKINEARVTLVKEGMPVSISIGAVRGSELRGVVTRVNKYAEAGSWSSGQVKEFLTLVKIVDPPPNIRSGMSAEVRIHVETRPEALQIPVQAVCEYKGKMFCLVQNGEDYDTREIKVGASNNEAVTIESTNLSQGEKVVMNPRAYPSRLQLPELPDPPPVAVAQVAQQSEDSSGDGAETAGQRRGGNSGQMMARFDTDGDGQLSADELGNLPQGLKDRLASADANGDGAIDGSELAAVAPRPRQGGSGGAERGPVGGGE